MNGGGAGTKVPGFRPAPAWEGSPLSFRLVSSRTQTLPALFPGQPFAISKPLVLTLPAPRNTLYFLSLRASYAPFKAQVSFKLGNLISPGRGGSLLTAHPALLLEAMVVSGCTGRKVQGFGSWASPFTSLSLFPSLQSGVNYLRCLTGRPVQSVKHWLE